MNGAGGHHGAYDVDVQRPQPIGAAGSGAVVQVRRGQVDQIIDAAKVGRGLGHATRQLRVVRDVHLPEARGGLVRPGHAFAIGGVDVAQRHAHALVAQRLDHARAAQRGAAGHDGNLVLQTLHRITSALLTE
ncbi:hypothetical protein G6F68_017291 [Rhizopus microsporus]|nr:hypothetical protein G6F68_017291 [Rhizopus microsporus]